MQRLYRLVQQEIISNLDNVHSLLVHKYIRSSLWLNPLESYLVLCIRSNEICNLTINHII